MLAVLPLILHYPLRAEENCPIKPSLEKLPTTISFRLAENTSPWDLLLSKEGSEVYYCFGIGVAEGELHVWDGKTGKLVRTLRFEGDPVKRIGLLETGEIVTSGVKHRAAILNTEKLQRIELIGEERIGRAGLAVSADGSRFTCFTGDRQIGVYRARDRRLLFEVPNPADKSIGSFALSQDGRLIAVGMYNLVGDGAGAKSDNFELIICDVEKQRVLWRTELDRPANWVAFLPGTTRVVLTSNDEWLRLADFQAKTISRLQWTIKAGALYLLDEGRHALITCWVQGEEGPIWSWGIWDTTTWKPIHYEETGMGLYGVRPFRVSAPEKGGTFALQVGKAVEKKERGAMEWDMEIRFYRIKR